MSKENNDLAHSLNQLLNTTANAREAYKNASKNVHNKPLTLFFEDAANEHEHFAEKLKAEIEYLGEKPKEKTSFKSDSDRFWMDFASIITHRNESALLKACRRAEEKTIEQYDDTLRHERISDEMKNSLHRQREYAVNQKKKVDELLSQYQSE
ncbi:MAG: ferritin-like domain-containing protein [Cyclobacteriaceae bacterium]